MLVRKILSCDKHKDDNQICFIEDSNDNYERVDMNCNINKIYRSKHYLVYNHTNTDIFSYI